MNWKKAGRIFLCGIAGFALFQLGVLVIPLVMDQLYDGLHPGLRNQAICEDVRVGLRAFRTEYNRYPVEPQAAAVEDFSGPLSGPLLNALLGDGSAMNPLRIKFMELPLAEKDRPGLDMSSPTHPVVRDSYGQEIRVVIDANEDGFIMVPHQAEPLKEHIAVWSSGPDGAPGNADDIRTWPRQK